MILTEKERELYTQEIKKYSWYKILAAAHEAGHTVYYSIHVSEAPERRHRLRAWVKFNEWFSTKSPYMGRCVYLYTGGSRPKMEILGSLAGGYYCGLFLDELKDNTLHTFSSFENTVQLNGGGDDLKQVIESDEFFSFRKWYYKLLLDIYWKRQWVKDLHLKYTYILLKTNYLTPSKVVYDIRSIYPPISYTISRTEFFDYIFRRKKKS